MKRFTLAAQAAREEEHRARVQETLLLARRILLPDNATRIIAVHSGRSHRVMGERSSIAENLGPVADITTLSPHGQVIVGVPSGHIDVVVNVGSALSSRLARTWDRHGNAETLERVGRPMIGSFVTEFDTSKKNVCVYINGEKVLEPTRSIVEVYDRIQRSIFEPELDEHGVPKKDALVIKVVRSRSSFVPSIITVEGWGPAGTLYGFRMLLENLPILSRLAKFAESKSESFEALIVVDGVHAEEVDGKKIMMATGPLRIEHLKPILTDLEEEPGIFAAYKTSTLIGSHNLEVQARNVECERGAEQVKVYDLEEKRQFVEQQENRQATGKEGRGTLIALYGPRDYNYEDNSPTSASLSRMKDDMPKEWEPREPKVETAKSQALKKIRDSAEELNWSKDISDEKKVEVFKEGASLMEDYFEACRKGIPFKQKAQALEQEKDKISLSLPKPGENYPLYPGSTDAVGWLEKHWGKYLKYFNPNLDRDYLYQDQLKKLDIDLYQGLKGQIYRNKENIRFRDIVPPKKERLSKEIETMSMEVIKKADRLEAALRRRRIREEKTR